MESIKTKLSDIKLNPNNPRLIKDDKFTKLVQSIKNFPEMLDIRPIVVNSDMVILGGNMRFKACKEAGLKEVPIIIADSLTEEQQREFLIKDNTSGGEWDFDLLQEGWSVELLNDWGLDIPKEKIKELDCEEDDFEPILNEQAITVLGDLYEIGNHKLICGDSTQTDTFKKLLGDEIADLVVTDPPYNVAYEGGTKEKLTIKNDDMSSDDFYKFLYDFYSAQNAFVKKGGIWYVWHADSEGMNFRKAMLDAGILLKQNLIWVKNTFVMGRQDYQWKHEPCLEGVNVDDYEDLKEYEPCLYGWKDGGSHFWKGGRKQSTILDFDKPLRNGEHPTMKPIMLFGKLITNSSKQGEIVCDAFGGSGTTMVACEQLNRKARIVEYDPKYCDVIVKRMIKLDPTLVIKRNGVVTNEFKNGL
jgi:site-specific DNA-methyltransferase (adenine-specific)